MDIKDESRKQQQHENPSSLLSQNPKDLQIPSEYSPRKQTQPTANNNTTNDRLKRDEWSEGAVSSLLEAYEAKWILRNRAKLKGQDWEDVAKHVSARANNSKSAKTQTQCKNKIESMKKRYRSESAAADASSWPLYPRLDLLLRGNGPSSSAAAAPPVMVSAAADALPVATSEFQFLPQPVLESLGCVAQNSRGSGGGDRLAKGNDTNIGAKLHFVESEKNPIDNTESSTPVIYTQKETSKTPLTSKGIDKIKDKAIIKRRREESYNWEIGESIRWLAEAVVRSEEARMETLKEIERMRAETETKRAEMDLKRTEIFANTQLEIARLFANGCLTDRPSNLRAGRS